MNNRRRMTGFVTSDKMTKTVIVEVSRTYKHPLYKKVVHASTRFMAHDELGAQVGDEVLIVESRPLSRHKHWVVESIVRKLGETAGDVQTEIIEEAEVTEVVSEAEPVEEPEAQEAASATETAEGE